ncbi:MAG: hypothetical protein LBE13_17595 [Bacteroidales bacterium]|jgi:hypothetical protein|nr:hypothetical protein [Bacteroidales bacterium]
MTFTLWRIVLYCFFILGIQTGMAQSLSDYTLIAEIDKRATFITMDKLGYIYACNGTTVDKYNEHGELLFSYSAFSAGRVSFIDAYNPLKIIVFFKDFMRLVFLDNKLTPQENAYLLSDINLFPTCVCTSYDNGFWVYDESVKQLFRYDAQQKLSNKSQDITYFAEKEINPSFIKESVSGFLLLNDAENGIFVFDHFGTYLKTIPVYTDYFYVMNHQILYVYDDTLKTINIQTLQQMNILLPEKDIQQVCIENKKMTVLTKENTIKIYGIKKNENAIETN